MRFILLFLTPLLCTSVLAGAQKVADTVLNHSVAPYRAEDIQHLIDKGYITEVDRAIIGSYLVNAGGRSINLANFTYAQLLDSLTALKQAFIKEQVKKYNYGRDSVFIRIPSGEKFLLGLGEMSFEALEERARHNLPESYNGGLNLYFDSEKAITEFATLQANNEYAWISGTVLIIERERGTLNKLRVGDIEEIARRIRLSKEFTPFVKDLK